MTEGGQLRAKGMVSMDEHCLCASRTVTDAAMRDFSCDLVTKLYEGLLDMVNSAQIIIGLGLDVRCRGWGFVCIGGEIARPGLLVL